MFGNCLYRVSAEHPVFKLYWFCSAIGHTGAHSDEYQCMLKMLIHQASYPILLWVTERLKAHAQNSPWYWEGYGWSQHLDLGARKTDFHSLSPQFTQTITYLAVQSQSILWDHSVGNWNHSGWAPAHQFEELVFQNKLRCVTPSISFSRQGKLMQLHGRYAS